MFTGIMIHNGTSEKDTRGCILVGLNKIKSKLIESIIHFDIFMDLLEKSGQTEWQLTIID
jgi:hypothetical protein